jgi:hypothetical protein
MKLSHSRMPLVHGVFGICGGSKKAGKCERR